MAVLDRIPVDDITVRARQARPGRVILTIIAGVLFGLGWVAYKACAAAWLAVAWCGSAVIEGWQEARKAEAVRRATPKHPR
jgi:uncharacterized membrane protein YedE/YeeE